MQVTRTRLIWNKNNLCSATSCFVTIYCQNQFSLWNKYQRLLSPTCSEIKEASASGCAGARLRVQHGGGGVIWPVFSWLSAVRLLSMGPTPPKGDAAKERDSETELGRRVRWGAEKGEGEMACAWDWEEQEALLPLMTVFLSAKSTSSVLLPLSFSAVVSLSPSLLPAPPFRPPPPFCPQPLSQGHQGQTGRAEGREGPRAEQIRPAKRQERREGHKMATQKAKEPQVPPPARTRRPPGGTPGHLLYCW